MSPSVGQVETIPDGPDVQRLLGELAEAARSPLPRGEFYALLVQRSGAALGALAAEVWLADGRDGPHCAASWSADSPRAAQACRDEAPPDPTAAPSARLTAAGLLLSGSFSCGAEERGALRILQRSDTSPAAQRGYWKFLEQLLEVAADFERRRAAIQSDSASSPRELDAFARAVHESLRVVPTAFVLANEGRRVLGVDRVSVLLGRGRRWRVLAASGVDSVDPHSRAPRLLARLARSCASTAEPLWTSEDPDALPPQVRAPLADYLDEAHPRLLGLVPLRGAAQGDDRGPGPLIGYLAIEQFTAAGPLDTLPRRAAAIVRHGELALANALAHERMPLGRLSRGLAILAAQLGWRRLPRTALLLGALGAAAATLLFVPAELTVAVRGQLQPALRREVFARSDGVVREVKVEHGQQVSPGQIVAVLAQPQLDLEWQRVAGEIDTAQQRLAALEAERLDASDAQPERQQRGWAAEQSELRESLRGLEAQRKVLAAQRADLELASPIAGRVLTWDVRRSLAGRPVGRGEALLSVADTDGAWILELRVPDHRLGHVQAALRGARSLTVSYVLATEPERARAASLGELALAAETESGASHPSVLASVPLAAGDLPSQPRPGASVQARIHCGRRSLGYVWLHDLFEFAHSLFW